MKKVPVLNYRKSDAYDQFNPYAAHCWYQMARNATEEQEANSLAGKYLRHEEILDFFDNDFSYITQEQIEECSEQFDVHTAIIIGALAYHKQISYKYLHQFTYDVRPQIPMDFYVEPKKQRR